MRKITDINIFKYMKDGFITPGDLTREQKQVIRALCITKGTTFDELKKAPDNHPRALIDVVVYMKQKGILNYDIGESLNLTEHDIETVLKASKEFAFLDNKRMCDKCLRPFTRRDPLAN